MSQQNLTRAGIHSEDKKHVHLWIPAQTKEDIDKYVKEHNTTITATLIAGFSLLLRSDVPASKATTEVDLLKELKAIQSSIDKHNAEEKELKSKAASLSDASTEEIKKTILIALAFADSVKTNQLALKLGIGSAQVFQALASLEKEGKIRENGNDNWRVI